MDLNDLDLSDLCGKDIAVSNAYQSVKDKVDEICMSNEEDGVAQWIEKILL